MRQPHMQQLGISAVTVTKAAALSCSSLRLQSPSLTRIKRRRSTMANSISKMPTLFYHLRSMATSSESQNIGGGISACSNPKPWLLVGLGNPGKLYQGTRHNVGFEMVDAIAEAEGISVNNIKFKAIFGKGHIEDVPIMLVKPQTFMNASGESVGSLVSYFNIPFNQVLLMYDDLDLPFAKLRLLPKGGHGGHNGMRSVIKHLKENREFPRLKIGIGRPPGKMDPARFVLRPFNKKEREELDFAIEKGVEGIRILVLHGINKGATFVNSLQSSELLNR